MRGPSIPKTWKKDSADAQLIKDQLLPKFDILRCLHPVCHLQCTRFCT